ncbi:OmpA family protein [Luteimonas terrae]|uniref:OOP family OmpA-OmpF porin n=1 Tax=Luteimonas terrae TaxID=1530191 RepID=A0ABU1XZ41_9GAMM|nr:OmpA family protein [Luteimonas terrae]MDR7194055.1 OOP family OmpA-OmpF porin [Luteimonas terrae]
MNKKLLCAALLGGLGLAGHASAQEFDDRWYLTSSAGFNFQAEDRRTDDTPFVTLGMGKFISPNWSVDGELNYQNPGFDSSVEGANNDLNWSQYGISVDFRYHFISEGRGWNPYLLAGVGYQRSEEEFDAFPSPNSPGERKEGNFAAKVGAGLQTTFDKRVAVRAEIAYRADFDDNSIAASTGPDWSGYPHNMEESYFGDVMASVGVVIPLGPPPAPPAPPAPPPPPPAPAPAPAPPAPITIDLNGVNFDFDRATLRPDAVAILNEAVEILQRYPELRVEVAGHTDSVGTDAYNQRLSERRAKAVYDHLASNGIMADRLVGPTGYGESRPIAPNTNADGSDNPEGRARNRRTELNVQN